MLVHCCCKHVWKAGLEHNSNFNSFNLRYIYSPMNMMNCTIKGLSLSVMQRALALHTVKKDTGAACE